MLHLHSETPLIAVHAPETNLSLLERCMRAVRWEEEVEPKIVLTMRLSIGQAIFLGLSDDEIAQGVRLAHGHEDTEGLEGRVSALRDRVR